MAWLARGHGLGANSIASHKDYNAQTVCPGRNLYRYLEGSRLRQAVQQRLRDVLAQPPPDIKSPADAPRA